MHENIVKNARRNHSVILKALAKYSQQRIAELIGISGSTLSTFKDDHIERLAAVLAACGLKVVANTDESVSADEIWALRVLAIKQLENGKPEPSGDSGFGELTS